MWEWVWIPDPPQEFGDNPVIDWVRLVVVLLGIILAMACARAIIEGQRRATPMPPGQAARFVALALADVYISLTEIAVFGTPGTPRLAIGAGVMLIGWYGVHAIRHKQRAVPPVR